MTALSFLSEIICSFGATIIRNRTPFVLYLSALCALVITPENQNAHKELSYRIASGYRPYSCTS